MGVKIYNYIDYSLAGQSKEVTSSESAASASTTSADSTADSTASFSETLTAAQKAAAALAIDAAIHSLQSSGQDGIALTSQLAYELGITSSDPSAAASSSSGSSSASASSDNSSQAASGTEHSASHSSASYTGEVTRSENYTTLCPDHTGTSGYDNSGTLACSDELQDYFEAAAEATGVDVKLIKAVAFAESSFRTDLVCSNGATGVMMLMPVAMEAYDVEDGLDPYENILAGARILADKLNEFDGDLSLAVAAYNAGSGAVKKYDGIPPYTETQNYVKKVTSFYNS